MQASKVSRQTLEDAAAEIGVTVEIITVNAAGTRHRVKLYPLTTPDLYRPACKWHRDQDCASECRCRRKRGEAGDSKYQRTSSMVMFREGRRVHAVCWHGFRDFFRAVYRREPDAVFRTAMATYRGSEGFEATFPETGHRNIGSQMAPVCAAEACRCPEAGMIGARPTERPIYAPHDSYGADEADGAACRAMANALRAVGR